MKFETSTEALAYIQGSILTILALGTLDDQTREVLNGLEDEIAEYLKPEEG